MCDLALGYVQLTVHAHDLVICGDQPVKPSDTRPKRRDVVLRAVDLENAPGREDPQEHYHRGRADGRVLDELSLALTSQHFGRDKVELLHGRVRLGKRQTDRRRENRLYALRLLGRQIEPRQVQTR